MSEAVGTPESGGGGGVKEQERFLPIANIGRIMQRGVPEKGKIAKDTKETIQECVSEFISFITSEASDKCMKENRKTINDNDLIWSMGTLGFEDYVEPLKVYLKLYREKVKRMPSRAASGNSVLASSINTVRGLL
ncbi:nuclear transcription factor Y subunit B-4-like [Hordeum vulgare subsp. vulgare]|uniref:nuclear transcription factor Y subunit B-4-like n=1 Tax=Hordeum vulgare subsp. vulgare TaxID=112509 RepID=UPI001D1A4588|nr:nuclear transcription factor Y subunit B-4-like [Hordeum vulgare subsp. vulgare]